MQAPKASQVFVAFGKMFSRNNYWVFFAIPAVGLVLSWGLVGKEALLTKGKQLNVMSTEDACHPILSPCAAYASDFALVFGGVSGKHFRLLAQQLPDDVEVTLMHLDDQSKKLPIPNMRLVEKNRWLITPTALVGRLRINMESKDQQWVAEFPLK